MHQTERAIFDLRRGVAVVIDDDTGSETARAPSVLVQPVEGLPDEELAGFSGHRSARLVITRHRLRSLGVNTRAEAASLPLRPTASAVSAGIVLQAACADAPLDRELFAEPQPATVTERAALALMRRALLIPAALTVRLNDRQRRAIQTQIDRGELLTVPARAAEHCFELAAGLLKRVSEARVPLNDVAESRFVLFREPDGLREHVAVVIGHPEQWPDAVPVRMHSACLTGDLFGSLRCDCGEQLRSGVRTIEEMGGGVLLYLAQEGRGIGLANKLRAYTLQDQGHDTVDADQILGFGEDERHYCVAVDMLAALNIRKVRLLTNNPSKLRALAQGGIEVAGREKLYGQVTDENRRYLTAKASRSGHLLEEVLDAAK
ncbi:GTP cyclohydrolase II [Wenzhouxiangella sp. C33]|uniref:GTP cyclohydrolase-2 n=2 Tax=Wenzhouxiangella limi TaxID=2707351 RepID=A0A845V082_9GAMM|nr:GTP cyclohydrolase II [Wenzhouxiangella limi]